MIIDPKKELFKWGPIDFKILYGSCFMKVVLTSTKKFYKWAWPSYLVLYQDGRGLWINEMKALQGVGLKYFSYYLLDKKFYLQHWSKYQQWIKDYQKISRELEKINWKDISDQKLYNHLKEFYDFNLKFWIIVHVPEIANWGGEYLLRQKLKKLFKDKADEYLEILSAPIKPSFFQTEELDLLKLANIKDKDDYSKALKKHAIKYYWLLNSYGGNRVLKSGYFDKKLQDLLKEKSAKIRIDEIKNNIRNNSLRKERLIKKIKLNSEIIYIAKQLSECIWWQDHRKAYIWKMNYFWDLFIGEIAKRRKWDLKKLQWMWPYELLILLKEPKKINKAEVGKRLNYYMLYGKNDNLQIEVDHIIIKKYLNIFWPKTKIKVKIIKGTVVSTGSKNKVSGVVKIIKDPFKDNNKMEKGDILVASMTSPEYIIAMKKAAAIIADEGGMTSHAAIVSRELNIPCIVGTKISTRALKDGDRVEVYAKKGIVTKIK